jgi:mannose-6-phosphate isomerase-like protein (cupin superfamily)
MRHGVTPLAVRLPTTTPWVSLNRENPPKRRAGTTASHGKRCVLADPGESLRRIATVPFTLKNLKEDLEDVGSRFDGAPDLEFRLATQALELEQSGLSYQRVPPGYRFPYGHTHKKQEEVYVVVRGSGRMKLDDDIVEVKKWDVVRIPPGTWRGYEAGPEGLEILVFGAPNLGENPRDDVEGQRDWWAD